MTTDHFGGPISLRPSPKQTEEERAMIEAWLADPRNYQRMMREKEKRRAEVFAAWKPAPLRKRISRIESTAEKEARRRRMKDIADISARLKKAEKAERLQKVWAIYRASGFSLKAVMEAEGISKKRVQQLLNDARALGLDREVA